MALALQQVRTTIKTVSGLDAIAGLWQITAPFFLGYSGIVSATWNDIILGVAVLLLAGSREVGENFKVSWPSWVNALIGVWFVIAPFAFGYSDNSTATMNDIIMGMVIAVLATWSALATPQEQT